MKETLFIIGFIAWYILALVVSSRVGKHRKIGEEWSFFLSFMLSPIIGLFISLASKKK
jgi:hypothetical protein